MFIPARTATDRTTARRSRGWLTRATPYLLLVLPVTLVLVAQGYPMLNQLIMSFQEFGLAQQFGQAPDWVGFDNYVAVLTDPYFWLVTMRSIAFCLVTAGSTMALGTGLALLMQAVPTIVRLLIQFALVLAWAMPVIAALQSWQLLFDSRYGLVNWTLSSLGVPGVDGLNWLQANPLTFYTVAAIVVVWASVPLVALSTYAALNQVDDAILEAASLDGASTGARLRHIVLPIIQPVVVLLGILQIIWNLRVFTQIRVLQLSAGNVTSTNLLGTYVYSTGIAGGDYGMASALATIMLLILLAMTGYYIRVLYRQGALS